MIRRLPIGVIMVAVITWFLMPLGASGVRVGAGMFVAGMVSGGLMYSRWSALIVPVVIGITGSVRYEFVDCPHCPPGESLPLLPGLVFLAVVYSIPAIGALVGMLIRGLVSDAIQYR